METDIRVFDTVDSTNITLSEMAENGAPEGTCVVAFAQRKGQGRSGRSFFSPAGGNLYMSLLLRPDDEGIFDMITVIAAVATVHAIENVCGVKTGIKWVNDLYRDDKKVCGILARAYNHGSDNGYVILGIGINIYDSDDVPEDIGRQYGSVFAKRCDLPDETAKERAVDLAGYVIREFSSYYDSKKIDEAVREYKKESIVTGKTVEYLSGDKRHTATVIGIDDDAGIILKIDGVTKKFRDGEIRIRPAGMKCCESSDESL